MGKWRVVWNVEGRVKDCDVNIGDVSCGGMVREIGKDGTPTDNLVIVDGHIEYNNIEANTLLEALERAWECWEESDSASLDVTDTYLRCANDGETHFTYEDIANDEEFCFYVNHHDVEEYER